MKTLFLIRHAKSSWASTAESDFDRPLNDRGLRDAPLMAQRLKRRAISIDRLITSPATRALQTCRLFSQELMLTDEQCFAEPSLYLASEQIFLQVIQNLDDQFHSVALFSHNPGITFFANGLSNVHIDNMPTCSIFAVSINTKHWSDFYSAKKKFLFFDFPKKAEA